MGRCAGRSTLSNAMLIGNMTIVIDDRERGGFAWEFSAPTISERLLTGDYTIEGFRDIICIERKRSANELSTNLVQDRIRFEAELARMSTFRHRYIICEFPLSNVLRYPFNEDLPIYIRKKIRVRGAFLLKRITEVQATYGVPFIFCASRNEAQRYAESLLTSISELI
jgi:ERCC4-type nuclease